MLFERQNWLVGILARLLRRVGLSVRVLPPNHGYGRGKEALKRTGPVVRYKQLKPHQLGWMRRPELDIGHIIIWEAPTGALYAHPKNAPPLLLMKLCNDKSTEHQEVPRTKT